MQKNTLLTMIIGVTVAVIMAAAVLVPVVEDSQTRVEPVTYSNEAGIGHYMREMTAGDVVTVEGSTAYLNGEKLLNIRGNQGSYYTLIYSDVFGCQVNGGSSDNFNTYNRASTVWDYTYGSSMTATYDGAVLTVTVNSSTTSTYTPSWVYTACNEGDASAYMGTVSGFSGDLYVSSENDVTLCGFYSTGENDTFYCYHDGTAIVGQDYTCDAEITLTPVEGTYDVYTVSVTFDVGDESFTPYRLMVPLHVSGHASTGASHAILGVIPLLVITAVLVGVVAAAVRRNEE